jgi:hypothetical protein
MRVRLLLLVVTGCASAATNLNPAQIPADQGAVIGRVSVFEDGQDITGSCYVEFADSTRAPKVRLSLSDSGMVATAMTIGRSQLSVINCTGGFVHGAQTLDFDVPGHGETTYFGDVRVAVTGRESGALKNALYGQGLLGLAIAESIEVSPGDVAVDVTDHSQAAASEYETRYGNRPRLRVSLVAPGGSRPPLPPDAEPTLKDSEGVLSAEARMNGLQIVWFGWVKPEERWLGFSIQRAVPEASLRNCREIRVVIDQKALKLPLHHESRPHKSGVWEGIRAEVDVETARAILNARSVDFDACRLQRRLSEKGVRAARMVLAEYQARVDALPAPPEVAPDVTATSATAPDAPATAPEPAHE